MKTVNRRLAAAGFAAAIAGMLAAGAWAQDSRTPPVAWWKLDEASGPKLWDSAQLTYSLALSGDSPTATVGVVDVPAGMPAGSKSVKFNGDIPSSTGEYAAHACEGALTGRTFTVSAWVKPIDIATEFEFIMGPTHKSTPYWDGWCMAWNPGTKFGVLIGASNDWHWLNSATYTSGTWYHVVFQVEDNGANDKYRLYVNGVLEDQNLTFGDYTPSTSAPGFVVGGRYTDAANTKWNGGIDDVQYYDYVLTSNDVAYLYAHPGRTIGAVALKDSYVAPLAWWKLDDTNGSTTLADSYGLYPMALDGTTPAAIVGSTDVPEGMPANSKSVTFNAGEEAARAYDAALNGNTFTVSAWVKPYDNTSDEKNVMGLHHNSEPWCEGWALRWGEYGAPKFDELVAANNTWQRMPGLNHSTGVWHHVVFQVEENGTNDHFRLYVNGTLDASQLTGWDYNTNTVAGFITFGGTVYWTKFNGGLDDVQYYNYSLTQRDVYYLYTHPGTAIATLPKGAVFGFR